MNEINFLPESYCRGRARQGRLWRQSLLILLALGALIGWAVMIHRGVNQLEARRDDLQKQVELAHQQQTELNHLRDEHAVLRHQMEIQRELVQPVSHTRIVSVLSRLLPDTVGITELTMVREDRSGKSGSWLDANRHTDQAQVRRAGADARLAIELQAIAPDGATIANLVEAFDNHPMFTSVSMRHSRSVIVRGMAGRQFRLELSIDLNRGFVLTDQAKAEGQERGQSSVAAIGNLGQNPSAVRRPPNPEP